MKAYAEAAALLDALAAYRKAPFEPVVVTPRPGRGPDGGVDDVAIAEAIKRAKRRGLLPPGVTD